MGLRLSKALNPEKISGEKPWPVYRVQVKSRVAAAEDVWRALEEKN